MKTDRPLALIIEDDPNLGMVFEQCVRQLGFRTRLITTGTAAMAFLQNPPEVPAVIVLDLMLPGVSGEQIIHYIRGNSDERLADVPVIVTTAYEDLLPAVKELASTTFVKPFDLRLLRKAVAGAGRAKPKRRSVHVSSTLALLVRVIAGVTQQSVGATADWLVRQALENSHRRLRNGQKGV